jgi:hypothetical protein
VKKVLPCCANMWLAHILVRVEIMLHELIKNSVRPNLHYLNRYVKFIDHCKLNSDTNGYVERHHIIPKSFYGSNLKNNLIILTARQHFIAHLLLAKGTNSPKMILALHKMVHSRNGGVERNYKINSKTYEYLRIEHAKIVRSYSKNTVTARHLYTNEISRIPKKLFDYYKNILYEGIATGRKDSFETRKLKSIASKRPRNVKQGTRARQIAASKWQYQTPKGFCETSADVIILYPSFTKNTLQCLNTNATISSKFASIHIDFKPHVGKTFKEIGFIKDIKHG